MVVSASVVSAHLAHIVLFGAWFAVIIVVLLIDHIRGRMHRNDEPMESGVVTAHDTRELVTTVPARISMATWPPPRPEIPRPRRPAPPTPSKDRRPRPAAKLDPTVQRFWLPLAIIGSLAAAAVHLVVLPEHFKEYYLYGTFFAVASSSQITYALILAMRPSRTLLRAGAAGNAAVIALWAFTRIVEVPIGPGRGATESVSGLDIVATTAETMALVACLVMLIRGAAAVRTRLADWSLSVRSLVPVCAVAIIVATVVTPPS